MRDLRVTVLAACAASIWGASCESPGPGAGARADDDAGLSAAPIDPTAPRAMPDTTPAGLWLYLSRPETARELWVWPGSRPASALDPAHGPTGTRYLNFIAQDGVTNGADGMARGSLVLLTLPASLEDPARPIAEWLVMYKAPGYRAHDGWFLQRLTANGEPAGGGEQCARCHEAAERDYVLGVRLGTPEASGLRPWP